MIFHISWTEDTVSYLTKQNEKETQAYKYKNRKKKINEKDPVLGTGV